MSALANSASHHCQLLRTMDIFLIRNHSKVCVNIRETHVIYVHFTQNRLGEQMAIASLSCFTKNFVKCLNFEEKKCSENLVFKITALWTNVNLNSQFQIENWSYETWKFIFKCHNFLSSSMQEIFWTTIFSVIESFSRAVALPQDLTRIFESLLWLLFPPVLRSLPYLGSFMHCIFILYRN